jgi:hypothetical protein
MVGVLFFDFIYKFLLWLPLNHGELFSGEFYAPIYFCKHNSVFDFVALFV